MKNNRGLSLIEVIVVLAIMAVVAGMSFAFMGVFAGNAVKECTSKISSTISKVRVDAMSKSTDSLGVDYYLQLSYRATDGKYVIRKMSGATIVSEEVIGSDDLTIRILEQGPSAETYDISPSRALVLKFERSTGGFLKVDAENYCKEITVSSGSRSKKIVLYPRTGKVLVE